MKKKFRPEFLNRLDGTVVFHALNKEHIRKIVDLMLSQVIESLKEKDISLEITDSAKDLLGKEGYDPVFGARPLRRTIQNLVEDPLAESFLQGEFFPGDSVMIDTDNEKIVIKPLVKEALST